MQSASLAGHLFCATFMLACAALAGCGGDGLVLHPVAGRATVDGTALRVGAVSFRPDAAKGNKSLHHPGGVIDSTGNFELRTIDRKGAPPGWYKVLVFADAHDLVAYPNGRPLTPKWLTDPKYISEDTTDLSVEVVATPAPGAYDLKCVKERNMP